MIQEKIFLLIFVLTFIPTMIIIFRMFSLRRKYYNLKYNTHVPSFFDLAMNFKEVFLNFRIMLLFPFFLPVKLIDDTNELVEIRKKIKKINIWFIIIFLIILAESLIGEYYLPNGFTL